LEPTGGCQCGAVRYTISRQPKQLIVCHCTQCQRRYGAFGMSLFFDMDAVRVTGDLKSYRKTADSGRSAIIGFCPDCGTTMTSKPEWRPDSLMIRAGTLDDTTPLRPDIQIWTSSKQGWVTIPDGIPSYPRQPELGPPLDIIRKDPTTPRASAWIGDVAVSCPVGLFRHGPRATFRFA